MVRDVSVERSEEAVWERRLPVDRAKHSVDVRKGGVPLFVRPSKSTAIEVDLLELRSIESIPEQGH